MQKFKVSAPKGVLPGANSWGCKLPSGFIMRFNRGAIERKDKKLSFDLELPLEVAEGLARDGYRVVAAKASAPKEEES